MLVALVPAMASAQETQPANLPAGWITPTRPVSSANLGCSGDSSEPQRAPQVTSGSRQTVWPAPQGRQPTLDGGAVRSALQRGVGWRELIVVALAVSCTFTFGLFFATGTFAIGSVLTESKVGALSTIVGAPLAMLAALLLGRERRAGG